ncbi:MAG: O-antigen ligase family protein [Gammaproteobacteria bacterium]|nr:O-antigen ligase family protein [Gammaproteobacteria bacterium]
MPLRPIERAALGVIWAGIGLILLIPFVVSGESAFFPLVVNNQAVLFPPTIFPYLVGKGLLFRCIVEVVFVAWTVLAVLNPAYRPPRSLPLGLLAVALGVSLVSALLGVSVVRSLFSTYERLGGVLEQAHWFAFAVVLVSVVRVAHWHLLLKAKVVVGMVIALWAVGQHFDVEALLWEWSKEGYGRITATLGNPIHLGAYVLVNSLVAAGFSMESLTKAASTSTDGEGLRSGMSGTVDIRMIAPWCSTLFWGLCAVLGAWVVTLTAARSAFLGLIAGFAAVAVLFAYLERGRVRLAVGTAAGLLAAAAVAFALLVATFEAAPDSQRVRSPNPLVDRTLAFSKRTVETRLSAWDAAAKGFFERPVFGWGPENYVVVLGRHGSEMGAEMRIHDNAHGRLAEELATKGALGVISHLAVWAGLLIVGLRAARRMGRRERIVLVFAGGALVGYFAQALVSPEVVTGTLQFTLLLAFVAVASRAVGEPEPSSFWSTKLVATIRNRFKPTLGRVRRPVLGVAAVVVSAALAGLGFWANKAAFSSASIGALAIRSSEPSLGIAPHRTREFFAEAIDAFEPMANQFRLFLFQYTRNRWRFLRTRHREEAARLLALVDAEAPAAVRHERENWEVPMTLAQMYVEVSATNPDYRAVAARHIEAAREMAPNRVEVRALPTL